MRILISAGPMYGHLNSVLPFAEAAQRAGHEVAVATGPDMAERVERRGLTAWPVGSTYAESLELATEWLDRFVATAEKRAVDLIPQAAGWRPDLVVSEETELAAPVAAACTGARHVVHGLGLMPPLRIWEALSPAVVRLMRQWDAPPIRVDALRDATYLEICPPALRPPGERTWRRALPLRPSAGRPAPGERLPDAIRALPHAHTVHLTLGTVFNQTPGVLETAVTGLRDLPVNLVVTTGPGTDPARFGSSQPPHVLVATYLPHALLLPRCDLVVSQGGAGILFGALAHGLPQLVLPQGADQFLNAEACLRAAAALSLSPDDVTAATVAMAATRLLTEPEFAVSARAVRVEIDAMPGPDSVVAALVRETA